MEFSRHTIADYGYNSMSIKLDTVYAIYAFVLTCGACVAGMVGSKTLTLVVTAMFALLIFKPVYLLGPMLFCTIFDDFLLVAQNASASRFLVLFFIAGAAISILQRGIVRKISLYFLLLAALGMLLSFHSVMGYTSFPISYVLNVVLAIAIFNLTAYEPKRIAKLLYAYAVLALVYIYLLLWKNGIDSLVDGARMTISEDVNSNALAMGLAIAMGVLVSNLLLFRGKFFLNILLIGANLVALFLTGSRTALITAVVAAFLLYMLNAQDRRSKRNAFILLIVSTLLLVFLYNILGKNFPLLMERFTVENVEETGGSGRVDVWLYYFTYLFPKYWLFGMGFNPLNLYYALVELSTEGHGAHNLLVEILSKTGVVGLALYTTCIVQFFRETAKKLHINKSLILPIALVITILINGIGEDVLTSRFLWFGIGLGYMLLNTAKKENEKLSGGNYSAR